MSKPACTPTDLATIHVSYTPGTAEIMSYLQTYAELSNYFGSVLLAGVQHP